MLQSQLCDYSDACTEGFYKFIKKNLVTNEAIEVKNFMASSISFSLLFEACLR